ESVVLMNWVELVIMNVAGILATVSLFKLEPLLVEITAVARGPEPQPPPQSRAEPTDAHSQIQAATKSGTAVDPSMKASESRSALEAPISTPGMKPSESVQDILDGLDISRIMRLEKSLNPQPVSLETLFKEESQAAKRALGESESITPAPGPAPTPPTEPDEEESVINLSAEEDISESLAGPAPARIADKHSGKHEALGKEESEVTGQTSWQAD